MRLTVTLFRIMLILLVFVISLPLDSESTAAHAQDVSRKDVRSISMPVFYATNRQRISGRAAPVYSKKRRYLNSLEYGQCTVTVPKNGIDFDAKRDFKLQWRGQQTKLSKPLISSVKSQSASEIDFFSQLSERAENSERVILFVHGYKSSFDGALEVGAQLESEFHAPVVIFSWPSSEEYLGYTKDECNIEWSLPHFKRLLQSLEKQVGTKKVTIIAHSMGNRLVMWSLRDRSENARCHGTQLEKFQDVVLTSPDVDTGTFKNYADMICENSDETWVLTSSNDNALRLSKAVHERKRLGMPGPDGVDADWRQPPVVSGLKTVEFTVLDKGLIGHSIQHKLIADLCTTSKVGTGYELVPEEKDQYKWLRLSRTK